MIQRFVVQRPLLAALVAAGALSFAMQVPAQSTSGDQSGASTATRPAAAAQGGNSSPEKTIPPSKSETADSAFKKLDATSKGYLTRDDAKAMPGFDPAFQSADANHDGKLSNDEFKKAWTSYTGNPQ
jgi:Ca2+-binding EF-hand superfamily protein